MTTFTASEVRELAKHMESVGWRPDSKGGPECYDEGAARSAEILFAFADILEAREKAMPARQFRVVPKGSTWTDVKDAGIWTSVTAHPESYETRVLYSHPVVLPGEAAPFAYTAQFEDGNFSGIWKDINDVVNWHQPPIPLFIHPAPADSERLAEALRQFRRYALFCEMCGDDMRLDSPAWREVDRALAAHFAQAQPPAASVPEVTELTWEPPNVTVDVERVGRFRSGDEHIVRVTFRSSDDGRRMTCFYAANESAVGYLHAMLAAQENPNG